MAEKKKSISRSLGEFLGHIIHGAKTKVDADGNEVVREEVSRTVEEEDRGEVTLRRTTIEEIEFRKQKNADSKRDDVE